MASRKKQQSHEPINLDDAFQVDVEEHLHGSQAPIVTGLSDEEDAARHLALRFNTNLKFCANCEVYYELKATGAYCRVCWMPLGEVGTSPSKLKRNPTVPAMRLKKNVLRKRYP